MRYAVVLYFKRTCSVFMHDVEQEIIEAMRLMWERMKIVVEPSGAASFAAIRSSKFQELGIEGPVGIIISGGNVDLSKPLPWIRADL